MLLTVFFESRSGVSNKEKSAGLADFYSYACGQVLQHRIMPTLTLLHFLQKNALEAELALQKREDLDSANITHCWISSTVRHSRWMITTAVKHCVIF